MEDPRLWHVFQLGLAQREHAFHYPLICFESLMELNIDVQLSIDKTEPKLKLHFRKEEVELKFCKVLWVLRFQHRHANKQHC
jgi:hypothetical protein